MNAENANNTIDKAQELCKKLYLAAKKLDLELSNAQEGRSSESRMSEKFTYGLMRGRWMKAHCSTLLLLFNL